jgi:hypothetical protein
VGAFMAGLLRGFEALIGNGSIAPGEGAYFRTGSHI